jgi:hypothetical protein
MGFVSKHVRFTDGAIEREIEDDPISGPTAWRSVRAECRSGPVTAGDGAAKRTARKACGFRTLQGIEIALLHVLGWWPEPKFRPEILLRRQHPNNGAHVRTVGYAGRISPTTLPCQLRSGCDARVASN